MTGGEVAGLVFGSAVLGALASSVINGVFAWRAKIQELERRDMEMALKMAELKNQQLLAMKDWSIKEGRPAGVDFWDPLQSVIEYRRGMAEYQKTW